MSQDSKRSRTFVAAVLVSAFLLAMFEAGFNYFIDPYGIYGVNRLIPGLREKRFTKTALLKQAMPKPELLILGSSRVRSMDPAYALSLFKVPAYNFGVDGANPSDWYAAARYAVDGLHDPIHIIILGVDTGSFSESINYVYSPAYVPELRRYLSFPLISWARTLKNLWSPFQLQDSYRTLKEWRRNARRGRRMVLKPDVRADGFITYIPHMRKNDMPRNVMYFRFAASNNREYVGYFERLVEFRQGPQDNPDYTHDPGHGFLPAGHGRDFLPTRRKDAFEIIRDASGSGVIDCPMDESKLNAKDFLDDTHSGLATGRMMVDAAHDCFVKAGGG